MTDKPHIELFPGSISDLERMTGKYYKAIKKDGKLVTIVGFGSDIDDIDNDLKNDAEEVNANALVHVTYFSDIAFGYAVKETDGPPSKEQDV